jgi:PAS domain S-box-containing protein
LRSVGDGLIATDVGGEIVFMNPAAEILTGWPAPAARGRRLMDVLGLLDEPEARPAKNPVVDLHPFESRAYTLVPKAGIRLPVEVQCFENRAADEMLGAIVAVRDIRVRKSIEERLVQSQRMEAVSRMAGGLAHEFNNHLIAILGYAAALAARLSGEERQSALDIEQAVSIAHSISSQLLTLSRTGAPRAEALNIQDLICEIQPVLSLILGNRGLTTHFGSPAGYIHADPDRLKQVLVNLAFYARDAMPAEGDVRIECATVEIGAAGAERLFYSQGLYARLRFADSGQGLDQAALARIFEPFEDPRTECGSGVGLSIAHSIVVQAGGYMTARSEPGKGTGFEILLPCIAPLACAVDGAAPHGSGAGGAPKENMCLS